jgi:spermidine synthase
MEFYERESVSLYLSELELIEERNSAFHHIVLYKHNKLGKVLIIDDEIMHVEKYECFYHEPLVHLPFAINPKIENVLILGGGSMFAAREVLKYKSVKKLDLCDHDKDVLNLMDKHYPHTKTLKKDKRFTYIENDALNFIQNNTVKYDLIINDCFDLSKTFLDKNNLYEVLDNHVAENGLCSDMIYDDIFDNETMTKSLGYLKEKNSLFLSLMCIPEYPGVLHLHTIWSKNKLNLNLHNPNSEQFKLFKNGKFEMYNPNYLCYYFYIPKFIKDIIE